MRIFTIGYEGATQASVIEALRSAGVALLADVRAVPLSRRPGFSKNILAAGLREAGIDYIGLKALGTPPEDARRRESVIMPGLPESTQDNLSFPRLWPKWRSSDPWRRKARPPCSASSGTRPAATARF